MRLGSEITASRESVENIVCYIQKRSTLRHPAAAGRKPNRKMAFSIWVNFDKLKKLIGHFRGKYFEYRHFFSSCVLERLIQK